MQWISAICDYLDAAGITQAVFKDKKPLDIMFFIGSVVRGLTQEDIEQFVLIRREIIKQV